MLLLLALLLLFDLRDDDIEECELLTDGQMLEHIVLGGHLKRHPQNHRQKQAFADRTGQNDVFRRLVDRPIPMQVVHTLAVQALIIPLTEAKDLGELLVALQSLERCKEVSVAGK